MKIQFEDDESVVDFENLDRGDFFQRCVNAPKTIYLKVNSHTGYDLIFERLVDFGNSAPVVKRKGEIRIKGSL